MHIIYIFQKVCILSGFFWSYVLPHHYIFYVFNDFYVFFVLGLLLYREIVFSLLLSIPVIWKVCFLVLILVVIILKQRPPE